MAEEMVWVFVKPGDPWLPGFEQMACWGGWEASYAKRAMVADSDDHERGRAAWAKENGYPVPAKDGGWFKRDKFRKGVFVDAENEGMAFIIPASLHDEIFGPKFNELGEIAP